MVEFQLTRPEDSPFRKFYEKRWGRPWPTIGDMPWNGDVDWSRIMYETMADFADALLNNGA